MSCVYSSSRRGGPPAPPVALGRALWPYPTAVGPRHDGSDDRSAAVRYPRGVPMIEVPPLAMSRAECLARLASRRVARVALSLQALPEIRPVRYQLDGEQLLFDVGTQPAVLHATQGRVIAFEVGDIEAPSGVEWSVSVVGQAVRIAGDDDPVAAIQGAGSGPTGPAQQARFAPNQGAVFAIATTRMVGWSLGPSGRPGKGASR